VKLPLGLTKKSLFLGQVHLYRAVNIKIKRNNKKWTLGAYMIQTEAVVFPSQVMFDYFSEIIENNLKIEKKYKIISKRNNYL